MWNERNNFAGLTGYATIGRHQPYSADPNSGRFVGWILFCAQRANSTAPNDPDIDGVGESVFYRLHHDYKFLQLCDLGRHNQRHLRKPDDGPLVSGSNC